MCKACKRYPAVTKDGACRNCDNLFKMYIRKDRMETHAMFNRAIDSGEYYKW